MGVAGGPDRLLQSRIPLLLNLLAMDQWSAEGGRQINVAINSSHTAHISFAPPQAKRDPKFLLSLEQEGDVMEGIYSLHSFFSARLAVLLISSF